MNGKHYIVVIFILLSMCADSQDIKKSELFYSTTQLIYKYSHFKGEYNTFSSSGKICDNVYDIIYKTSNEQITIEQKLDILHLMIFYQRYSTNEYRGIIREKVLNKDSLICNNYLFVLPILICPHCKYYTAIEKAVTAKYEQYNMLAELNDNYKEYYFYTLRYLYLLHFTNHDDILTQKRIVREFYTLLETKIINSKRFDTLYPDFKKIKDSK